MTQEWTPMPLHMKPRYRNHSSTLFHITASNSLLQSLQVEISDWLVFNLRTMAFIVRMMVQMTYSVITYATVVSL